MVYENVKKFLAFEWLMILIFGFFWAAAMYLPLFLTGSFDNKGEFWKNMLIMFGPYVGYFVVRLIFLFGKSIKLAYLVSNFFFTSEEERKFAQEWLMFVLIGLLWAAIMVYPLYLVEMFARKQTAALAVLLMATPYLSYLGYKVLKIFLKSIGWAVNVTTSK